MNYESSDLGIIIPTKDRPGKIKNLLNSIKETNQNIGQVIVIASGVDIYDVIKSYTSKLNIFYKHTEPGQIFQRNVGLTLLKKDIKIVATIDDDILFEKNSIKNILYFWNNSKDNVGGVGFNIINTEKFKKNIILSTLNLQPSEPGKVISNGNSSSICDISNNISTQWLNGGATTWKAEILKNYKNKEINIDWAVCEDKIFSYPIGKKYDFFICHNAKIKLQDNSFIKYSFQQNYKRYKSAFIMLYYFVKSNDDLKIFNFLIYQVVKLFYFSITFPVSRKNAAALLGQVNGFIFFLKTFNLDVDAIRYEIGRI